MIGWSPSKCKLNKPARGTQRWRSSSSFPPHTSGTEGTLPWPQWHNQPSSKVSYSFHGRQEPTALSRAAKCEQQVLPECSKTPAAGLGQQPRATTQHPTESAALLYCGEIHISFPKCPSADTGTVPPALEAGDVSTKVRKINSIS